MSLDSWRIANFPLQFNDSLCHLDEELVIVDSPQTLSTIQVWVWFLSPRQFDHIHTSHMGTKISWLNKSIIKQLEFSCISRKVKFWINHLDHESRYIHPRMPMLEIKQDLPWNSCIYLMIHLISSMFSDPERSPAHYIAKW